MTTYSTDLKLDGETHEFKLQSRTLKELFAIVLANQFEFNTGLCRWILNLYELRVISEEEHMKLYMFIVNNPPLNARTKLGAMYYWAPGVIEPRIEWIEGYLKILPDNL